MSRHVSLRIALLDKQLVESARLPIGRIDDLEIELDGAVPRIGAILTGAEALGDRLGGTVGNWMSRTAARLRSRDHPPGPIRIEPEIVDRLEPMVQLGVPLSELHHVATLEKWLAREVVEPAPGAGDASH